MKCTHCEEKITGNWYVAYGGMVWCSAECIAQTTAKRNLDVDTVAKEMQYKKKL